jgi:hypothetical protein
VITAPYESVTTDDINVGIVTALLDEKNAVYGVVGMDMTLPDLTRYIRGIKVGHKGQMLLLDRNGAIVASQRYVPEFVPDGVPGFSHIREQEITEGRAVIKVRTDGTDNYLFFYTSPELNWVLAFLIPAREIDSAIMGSAGLNIAILALSIVLLSIVTIFGLRKYVVAPVNIIHKGTQHIKQTGDYGHHVNVKTNDELDRRQGHSMI